MNVIQKGLIIGAWWVLFSDVFFCLQVDGSKLGAWEVDIYVTKIYFLPRISIHNKRKGDEN